MKIVRGVEIKRLRDLEKSSREFWKSNNKVNKTKYSWEDYGMKYNCFTLFQ